MIKILAFAIIGLIIEAFLLMRGVQQPLSLNHGLALLSLHSLICLACATLMRSMLPPDWREPRFAVIGLFFALAFFIPLAGGIALWLILISVQLWPTLTTQENFRTLTPPEFTLQGDHLSVRFGAGGVRARLADRNASAESRLEALLAIKAMPQRLSSSILRSLLDDPEEDLRLLAYGMLDSEEKRINEQINLALNEYHSTQGIRTEIARRLAFLYWELVYQNLVLGDVRLYALQEAGRYANETLTAMPEDAGTWVLLGKVRGAYCEWDRAHDALQQGLRLGYPETRLQPYLAEHAFRQRDFAKVKKILQSMESLAVGDVMQPVIRFWTKP